MLDICRRHSSSIVDSFSAIAALGVLCGEVHVVLLAEMQGGVKESTITHIVSSQQQQETLWTASPSRKPMAKAPGASSAPYNILVLGRLQVPRVIT
jgi:hypothetical protein